MSLKNNIASSGARQNNFGIRITFFFKKPVYYALNRLANALRESTTVLLAGFSISANTDLWAHAYGLVQKREGKLMEQFIKHMAKLFLKDSKISGKDVPDSQYVKQILINMLLNQEDTEIQVSHSRFNDKIRKQIEALSEFHILSRSIVKDAVDTKPHFALAWSGISIFLTVISHGPIKDESMLKGLNTIGRMQLFWRNYAETFIQLPDSWISHSLRGALAKLYSLIIEYEARCICYVLNPQRYLRVVGLKDLDKMIKSIQAAEEICLAFIAEAQKDEVRRNVKLQLEETQKSRVILERSLDIIVEDVRDKRDQQLLNDLADGSMDYTRYKDINPKRVQRTCEWFLTDNRFCNWRDGESGQLLWLSAGPGCGKSVLSRSLIDEGLLNLKATVTISSSTITECKTVVCYFFFKEIGDGLMDNVHALCALLHQLFKCQATSSLITHAFPSYRIYGKTLTQKFDELWKILVECANNSAVPIICVLDGLDECKEDGRRELFDMLQTLYSSNVDPSIPSKLKFLVTSRPYGIFESLNPKLSSSTAYTYIDADEKSRHIGKEINRVIDYKMGSIAKSFGTNDRDRISKHIKNTKSRTYLWLYLTLSIIEAETGSYSRGSDIKGLLSRLPPQVADAYEKILSKCRDDKKVETLLQIVLAATRPLTLDEANYALTLALEESKISSYEKLDQKLWPRDTFKTTIQNLCGLFISIHDNRLSFIHQTAKEFLLHPEQTGTWKGRLSMPKSHGILSGACIKFLQCVKTSETSGKDLKDSLFSYAANNWFLHYRSQEASFTKKLRKPARQLCRLSAQETRLWVTHFNLSFLENKWTDLAFASYLGLDDIVRDIVVDEHADVETRVLGKPPLRIALDEGHLNVMNVFLGPPCGVKIRQMDLSAAAFHKSNAKAIMSLLLDKLDGCDSEVRVTEEVLKYAAENRRCGAATIALLLKRRGNEVKITPAVAESAVWLGSIETIALLLDQRGHEFDITEELIKEALKKKKKDMLDLFLKCGGDKVQITDTVLLEAIMISSPGNLALLLDACTNKITKEIVISAARKAQLKNMAKLLEKRGHEIVVTNDVLKAAEENTNGLKMKSLLEKNSQQMK